MKVREIAALAAENMGREDLAVELANLTDGPSWELKALLRCYNLVENEVAIDYFPLKQEECVLPQNGIIEFSSLARYPVEIYGVRGGDGKEVAYRLHPAHLSLPEDTGAVTVTYSYSPAQKDFSDESEFQGKISARLLAFGMAGEFCLSTARFNEAAVWQKKFQDALKAVDVHKRRICIRARRWV